MLSEGVAPALIENAADDRHADAAAVRSPTRSAIDLGVEDPEGDRGRPRRQRDPSRPEEADRGHGRGSRAVSDGRIARASTTIPRSGPKSLWPDLKKIAGKTLDPDTDPRQGSQGSLPVSSGARGGALHGSRAVVTDPREADIGSVFGFGYPPSHREARCRSSTAWGLRPSSPGRAELAAGPRATVCAPPETAGRDGRERPDLSTETFGGRAKGGVRRDRGFGCRPASIAVVRRQPVPLDDRSSGGCREH